MNEKQTSISDRRRRCNCNQVQVASDARALGFEEEFRLGIYSCCQVVKWAGEQRQVFLQAEAERQSQNAKASPGTTRKRGKRNPQQEG